MTRIDPSALPEWERELLAREDAPTGLGRHAAAVVSDLERAQEWLGCERYQDAPLVSNCWQHVPGQPKIADLTWPCSEATRLAALLAETRADEATNIADALSRCGGLMSIKTASALIRGRAFRHHRASKP